MALHYPKKGIEYQFALGRQNFKGIGRIENICGRRLDEHQVGVLCRSNQLCLCAYLECAVMHSAGRLSELKAGGVFPDVPLSYVHKPS